MVMGLVKKIREAPTAPRDKTMQLPDRLPTQKPKIRAAECKEIKSSRVKNQVLGEATDAETNADIAAVREVPAAASRAAVPGEAAPRAAAQQPALLFLILLDIFVKPSTAVLRRSFIVLVPMIQAPLPHIAMHVMPSPRVRG
jgi:hypothetical protein